MSCPFERIQDIDISDHGVVTTQPLKFLDYVLEKNTPKLLLLAYLA
jgi:hypothetical protein